MTEDGKMKNKRFTYNVSMERKERLINACVEVASRSKKYITWWDFLTYIADSYSNNVINDMNARAKFSPSVKKATYNILGDKKESLIEVAKKVSEKLNITIRWSEVLSFMIDNYIDNAVEKLVNENNQSFC
ncbi:hypothetical protein [Gilliamella sp. BG7]|uniref:hypothetical protein n=1 Tax=unclassified Gilliamella TaxID=2685620 RepID=UPI0039866CA6